jgi:hypothetical protein
LSDNPICSHHRDENPVTATPLDSVLTNRDARKPFRILTKTAGCRPPFTHFRSLFSLFHQRVKHNSFAISALRTLFKNTRGGGYSSHSGTQLRVYSRTEENRITVEAVTSHQSRITLQWRHGCATHRLGH